MASWTRFPTLPPRFIMQLILIILPSVNRLMQQSARLLPCSSPLPPFRLLLSLIPASFHLLRHPSSTTIPTSFPPSSPLPYKSLPCSFHEVLSSVVSCRLLFPLYSSSLFPPSFSFSPFNSPSPSLCFSLYFFFFFSVTECVMSLQLIPSLKHLSNAR